MITQTDEKAQSLARRANASSPTDVAIFSREIVQLVEVILDIAHASITPDQKQVTSE